MFDVGNHEIDPIRLPIPGNNQAQIITIAPLQRSTRRTKTNLLNLLTGIQTKTLMKKPYLKIRQPLSTVSKLNHHIMRPAKRANTPTQPEIKVPQFKIHTCQSIQHILRRP
jgi:hypothetical protein